MTLGVAVLTVSDTASKDASVDKSGPLVKELVQQHAFKTVVQSIVPDDETTIRSTVKSWSERGDVDWIITTGGTGFGPRDRTPEAIRPLIQREAPGLVHLMLSTSLTHTPLAALSRPVAGTIGNVLIITLPGSVKAVRENLTALLSANIVSHAVDLNKGGSGEAVHAQLGQGPQNGTRRDLHHIQHDPRHHHHHADGHQIPIPRTTLSQDPSLPVHARHRKSPYPLLSYEDALASILRETPVLSAITKPVTPALRDFVLAEDVFAPCDIPPSPTTNVDGYALRSSDPTGDYKVLTPHTHNGSIPVPSGSIYRINTGAPLPAGTDSVIMVEDSQLVSAKSDTDVYEDEDLVRTLAQVDAGENVRKTGSDVKKGALVLQKGEILHGTGGEVGTLVFVGQKEVSVYRKPVVAILSTGNELVDLHKSSMATASRAEWGRSDERWTGVWDCNRPSLQAALESLGYDVIDLGIVNDDVQAHVHAIREGLLRADIVLTTGGTSMGSSDLLKPVIERYLNGTIHFGRVTVKPGKPTTFATVLSADPQRGAATSLKKPIFALPGNPASALVTFYIFVVPALRKLGGWPHSKCRLPQARVKLRCAMPLDPRTEFHRVTIAARQDGLTASTTGGQRSSRIASLSGANGLVVLPRKRDWVSTELKAGEFADAVVIGEIQTE